VSGLNFRPKANFLIFLFLFLFPFIFYLNTLCPNIYWRDASEFQGVAYLLGIAHPAGSPLYALSAKIFTFIPIGSIGFRVNLFSTFFGALVIPLTFLLLKELLEILFPFTSKKLSLISGAIAVSFYAVSNSLWDIAKQAEVYTFQNCFIVLIAFFLLRGFRRRKESYFYLASFFLGLSFGAHIIMLLYLPAFFLFLLIFFRRAFSWYQLGLILIFLILGASIYLYLPVRSSVNPYWDWGNPENFHNFITHITDKKDAKYHTYFSWGKFIQGLKNYGRYYWEDFGFFGLILGVIGLPLFFKRNSRLFLVLGFFFYSQWFFFIRYWRSSSAFIATFLFFTLSLGVGIFFIFNKVIGLQKIKKWLVPIGLTGFILLIGSQVFSLGVYHWKNNDRSDYWLPYEFFKHIYDQIEFKGVLITTNYQFGASYLQQCEKYRPDVTLLFLSEILAPQFFHEVTQERYPLIKVPKVSPGQKAKLGETIINANIQNQAFYWDPTARAKFYKLVEANLVPVGFLFSITPSPSKLTAEVMNNHHQKIEADLKSIQKENLWIPDEEERLWFASIFCNQAEFFTRKNEKKLGIKYHHWALNFMPENYTILNALGADYAGIGNFKRAEFYLKKALQLAPAETTILKNLGQLYLDNKNYPQAIYYYQKYLSYDSKNPQVYYNLAFCYTKINKMKEAQEALQKIIQLDPQSELAKKIKGKLLFQNK